MCLNFNYNQAYKIHKEAALFGRYITNTSIKPLLDKLSTDAKVSVLGWSVNKQPIYAINIGSGSKKILMWSQMHGNESTTTKALFDLLNTLKSPSFKPILSNCTLCIIPILNPDGALLYTRLNANGVDLNRDAQNLSQPESLVLNKAYTDFKPDYCLNLHGQRTIFNVGTSNKPATVSFLAPAQDTNCTLSNNRKRAMKLITVINNELQRYIPNQVGLYDDNFNINCVGDTFQANNTPTLLFEAGHIDQDYQRERVREYIYIALLSFIKYISNETHISEDNYEHYFKIPKNGTQFYDIIIKNTVLNEYKREDLVDIAIQFEEVLKGETINFMPKISQIGDLNTFFGHRIIDAQGGRITLNNKLPIIVGAFLRDIIINNQSILLKI